jgi:CRISPR/Cas system-associated endonuclease Cas1
MRMVLRVLVAAAVVLAALGAYRGYRESKRPRRGLALVYRIMEPGRGKLAVDAVRDRVEEKGQPVEVHRDGDELVVELAEPDGEIVAAMKDIIARRATLDMQLVVECAARASRTPSTRRWPPMRWRSRSCRPSIAGAATMAASTRPRF